MNLLGSLNKGITNKQSSKCKRPGLPANKYIIYTNYIINNLKIISQKYSNQK